MTSREYFDQVRTAVADVRRAEETLDYWESRIDSLGGGSTGPCCGYRDPDRMTGKLSALWDARDRAERKLDGMVELQDEAIAVIGMVGDAGRASTSLWRDVLLDRYVLAMTYSEIAEKRGRSFASVRRAVSDALDWIDSGPGIEGLLHRIYKDTQVI